MKSRLLAILAAATATVSPAVAQEQNSEIIQVAPDMFLRWYGHADRTYFVQISDPNDHLRKWIWAPIIETGNDEDISYEVDGTADKGFFRLWFTDEPTVDPDGGDFDGDGLSNLAEVLTHQTNPLKSDTDGDGLLDGWEIANSLDPNDDGTTNINNGGSGDPDNDGLTNAEEQNLGTDPNDADSDDDGITDGGENDQGTDPNDSEDTPDAEWFILTGDLDQDEVKTRKRTVTIPAGQSRVIAVVVASDEYPDWTGDESEFNDTLEWDIQPSEGAPLQGSIDVNARHGEWEEAELDGRECQGFTPAHVETGMTLTAPDDAALTVEIELSATNIGDGAKPSTVMVALQPVEVVSRDRMIAGSIRMLDGWDEKLQLQFVHKDTGEDLGTYGNLLSKDQGAYLYDSDHDMFNDSELASYDSGSLDSRIRTEDVIFCKRPGEEDVVEFYTVFGNVGDVEIKLILDGEEIGSIDHTLEQDEVFSNIIDYINDLVTNSPDGGGPIAVAAAAAQADEGSPQAAMALDLGNIDPLAKRALVSIFNSTGALLGAQADIERLIVGLFEGVKQGAIDDWKLLQMLGELGGAAALQIADNLPGLLVQETQRWMDDPYKRASDIATIIHQLVENAVLGPLAQFGDNFTSWNNFKKFSWGLFSKAKNGAAFAWSLTQDMTGAILNGLGDWAVDFSERMYEGAEKTIYSSVPFGPVDPWRQDLRTFYYTFGYTFGYLAEQVLLGKGIGAVAKGMSKAGGKIALNALPHVKRFGARVMPIITKKWSSKVITTAESDAWTVVLRETQTEALEKKTLNGIPIANNKLKPVAESIDEAMETHVGKFHGKLLQEEIDALPRLKGAVARKAVLSRLGILSKLMGDRLDDAAAKNFVKIYERKLLLDPAIGKDYFDDFIKAVHSKGAGPSFKLDNIDDTAKDFLELFLKEPDPGSPWKLSTAGGNPPRNHFARGNLIELDAAKHGKYKDYDWLDEISESGPAEAVDFRKVTAQGTEFVQETSTMSNDVFTQQLGSLSTKLEKVAQHASQDGGNKAVLDVYILEGRNPDLSSLRTRAAQLSNELEIAVEVRTTASKYAGWLAD